MIDLHSHTKQSDGTLSPQELIWEARSAGVDILAITDHDTFAGYDQALEPARKANLELICGIELSTKLGHQSVHLLGYFICRERLAELRSWVLEMQTSRHERNSRLVARLQELGLDITLDEASARGRGMTGRPHFAQIMIEKGYVANIEHAFRDYLGESAKAYVSRKEPTFAEAVGKIREVGGIASLAHPVRMQADLSSLLPELCDVGLNAIEAYHSDHGPEHTELYLSLAKRYSLQVTGGSDFHGPTVKPGIKLGTGRNNNLRIPGDLVERLRPQEPYTLAAPKTSDIRK